MSIAVTAPAEARSPETTEFRFGPSVRLPMIRGDLKVTAAPLRGRSSFVVKDPVALKYFRWGAKEHRLASLLDGKRNVTEVLRIMQREFPDEEFNERNLQGTMNHFLNAGLLITDGTVAQRIFHQQTRLINKAKRSKLWLSILSKIISFKITLFDPDLLLMRLNRKLKCLWSWQAVAALLGMLAVATWFLTLDRGSLAQRMPDILGWQNLVILWIVLILVKVVHEFGHGLSCKHFGGEVHEMGAMFILFSPFLFCNATDSWVFHEKRKRMTVNFAGIYMELFLASVAAVLWVLTQPGIFNQICFNVMLVCSVTTIFFNVNPLMKYDGYYALSDAIEVPNLKERADRALITRLAGVFTGGEGVLHDPIIVRLKWFILIYAVASYAWTFSMAYNILRLMGRLLQPVGLDRLAQAAAGLVLILGIVTPPFFVGFQIFRVVKSDESGEVGRRVAISVGILLAVLFGISFIPVPVSVKSACVIDASNRVRVTAPVPGFLRTISVRDGQAVRKDQLLAVVQNRDLDKSLVGLKLQRDAALIQEAAVISAQNDRLIAAVRSLTAQFEAAVAKYSADQEASHLRTPTAGIVIGTDLLSRTGAFIQRGELFCEIIPDGPLQAVVALKESETPLVQPGQSVSFRLHSFTEQTFRGKVLSVAPSPVMELPHQALGQQAGGTVPSVMMGSPQQGGQPVAIPSAQIYKALVAIENPGGLLRPGMSGRIKISCGNKPLGVALILYFRNMIRTDFQL
jgi:putative peptide zinc metalloprotease protein